MKTHNLVRIEPRLHSGEPELYYCDGKRISREKYRYLEILAKRSDCFQTWRTKRDREHGKYHHGKCIYL